MNLRVSTLQRLALLAAVGLAIGYVALLRPLAQRVAAGETPLLELREELARATLESGLPRGTSFQALAEHLAALRAGTAALVAAEREARHRLEHPPEVVLRLSEPFQFVEFLNESQRRLEELGALAGASKVKLTPGLPRGFPQYQYDLAHPEWLWVQLAMVNRVVRTAIVAGVSEVVAVAVEPLSHFDVVDNPSPGPWAVLRLHLTVTGEVNALGRLLVALALTPEELSNLDFPDELTGRPALFLDQILVRRDQLEAAERAQLDLVVSTVIARDEQ